MTLLRELPDEKRTQYVELTLREQRFTRKLFLNVGARAVAFLVVVDVVSFIAIATLGHPVHPVAQAYAISLRCLLLSLMLIGFLAAFNFEVGRVVLKRLVERTKRTFRSELPVETEAKPLPAALMYVPSIILYVAFLLWIVGAGAAYHVLTTSTSVPAPPATASGPSRTNPAPEAPPQGQLPTTAPATPPIAALKERSGWSLSDTIAVVSTAAAFLQFLALVLTVGVMRSTSRRQLRAYTFPSSIVLFEGSIMKPPQPAHENEPGVVIEFRNCGQTPAYRLVSWAAIAVLEPINEEKLVRPEIEERFSLTLPTNGTSTKALWLQRKLSEGEINDIRNHVRAIYVYGRIEYLDVYKKRRYSNFRMRYSGPFPPEPGHVFSFCNEGNEAE
jgi:hypothetical protein